MKPKPSFPPSRSRRSREASELEAVAERFRKDWRPGDRVMTWLRLHEGKRGELSALVEAGWTWDQVSQAMHRAGITYSTGNIIPALTLRVKAHRARKQSDRQEGEGRPQAIQTPNSPVPRSAGERSVPNPVSSSMTRPEPPPPTIALNNPDDEAEDEFRPARLLNWGEDPPAEKAVPVLKPKTAPTSAPAGEMSAALARLLGRKTNQ